MTLEKPTLRAQEILKATPAGERLPEGFWMQVMHDIRDTIGEDPNPLSIRGAAIVDALGIPWGEHSALTTKNRGGDVEHVDLKKDREIAKLLTNIPGVHIEKSIVSCDIRDLYKAGDQKSEELLKALEPDVAEIIRAEYEIRRSARNKTLPDSVSTLFRLPGGISVFLRGYEHRDIWHKKYGVQLAAAYAKAQIVGIEGGADKPFGTAPLYWWSHKKHYGFLMKQLVENGFGGGFSTFDARNDTIVSMDAMPNMQRSTLPRSFFRDFYEYLAGQNPNIAKAITTADDLSKILHAQASTSTGLDARDVNVFKNTSEYQAYPSLIPNQPVRIGRRHTATTMTGLELGQFIFADALSALKLHSTARLMAESKIKAGVMVDFEGAYHTSAKSFFMRYPLYAAIVVLNNIHELMAETAEANERNNQANVAKYAKKIFIKPDWAAIFKEITKLAFFDVKDGKLVEHPIDYCKTFDIDPATAIPDDKSILEIMDKLKKAT